MIQTTTRKCGESSHALRFPPSNKYWCLSCLYKSKTGSLCLSLGLGKIFHDRNNNCVCVCVWEGAGSPTVTLRNFHVGSNITYKWRCWTLLYPVFFRSWPDYASGAGYVVTRDVAHLFAYPPIPLRFQKNEVSNREVGLCTAVNVFSSAMYAS